MKKKASIGSSLAMKKHHIASRIGLMVFMAISIGTVRIFAQEAGVTDSQNPPGVPGKRVVCKDPDATCMAHTLLKFESKNSVYDVGYIEEIRRLPPGARRPIDVLHGGYRISTLSHQDMPDADHYALYRLCYGQDTGNETFECRQLIETQPEIGQIHPEVADPKRIPYDILIFNVKKEIRYKPQFLTITLWMQENREPTDVEKQKFNKSQQSPVQTASGSAPVLWEVPVSNLKLEYQFVENGGRASFEATEATRDIIKSIGESNHKAGITFDISGPLGDRPIVKNVIPQYPDWAQERNIVGSVRVYIFVTPAGTVQANIRVTKTSGYSQLDQLGVDALKQWQFAPMNSSNEGKGGWGIITFNFSPST